jgi:hypothetical protein
MAERTIQWSKTASVTTIEVVTPRMGGVWCAQIARLTWVAPTTRSSSLHFVFVLKEKTVDIVLQDRFHTVQYHTYCGTLIYD